MENSTQSRKERKGKFEGVMNIKIIAHRGNSDEAPENTKIAFEQAINMGVDFLECDVQMTKDDVPVIIHDDCFSRVTKKQISEKINKMNFSEIKKIDIGSWFDKKYSLETILTLEEFLSQLNENIGVMLDLKEETIVNKKQALKIGSIINSYRNNRKNHSKVLVGSLKSEILYTLKEMIPETDLLPIIEFERQFDDFKSLQSKIYALYHPLAKKKMIDELHLRGIEVWAWVVDDAMKAKKLIERGVDGIITNKPQIFFDV